MSLIDTADLALLRAVFVESLGDLATISRGTAATQTRDTAGGFTEVTPVVASNVKCRVTVPSGTERKVAEKLTEDLATAVKFAWDTDVRGRDYLLINGTAFKVLAVLKTENYATYQTALCAFDGNTP